MTASGIAATGLAGCSGDASDPGSGTTRSSSPQSATPSTTPDVDPDRAALDRAFAISSALLADLASSNPRLDAGGRLAVVHEDHLAAITAASPADVPTESSLPRPARRLTARRLRERELAAQRELAGLARGAESGAVARLLASMSAGVAAALTPRGGPG